ncbi:MAG: CapA family protein [Cyanobacteria bacterium J06639_16]
MADWSNLVALARQGNVQAIAQLIQQFVIFDADIAVSVDHEIDCDDDQGTQSGIRVLLEAPYVPDPQRYAHKIYAAVLCLGATSIHTLQIEGQRKGDPLANWQRQWPLDENLLKLQDLTLADPIDMTAAAIAPTTLPTLDPAPRPYPSFKQSGLVALVAFALSLVSVLGFAMIQRGGLPRLFAQRNNQDSPNTTQATPQTVPDPEAPALALTEVNPAITIKAVGDIIPGTDYPNWRLPGDPNYLFNSIKPFLVKEADILFGNFESTLTDFPNSAKDISRGMTFAFRTPPAYADVLTSAGFDVLSVANNHSFDFGEPGFNDTIVNIENAGMKAVGRKGQIVYVDEKGLRTAFIAFSYFDHHNSMHDLPAAQALIEEADQQADIVVISVHAGAEGTDALNIRDRTEYFYSENRGNLVQFSRAVIDYGADLVLGHGPHVPRAIELYKGKLVAYSLGNFLGHETLSTEGSLGSSMILQAGLDPEGNFVSGRVIPVALDPNGVPYLDDYFQSVILVRNLTQSNFPQTPLIIDDMGYILHDSFTAQ